MAMNETVGLGVLRSDNDDPLSTFVVILWLDQASADMLQKGFVTIRNRWTKTPKVTGTHSTFQAEARS